MNAKSLQSRVTALLKRVNGMDRTVFIRTYTPDSNSDELTGRIEGSTVDTEVSPQPTYKLLTAKNGPLISPSGKRLTPGDYELTFAGTSITEDTLNDPTSAVVLKDEGGDEEVLRVIDINSVGFQSLTLVWTVIGRSDDTDSS